MYGFKFHDYFPLICDIYFSDLYRSIVACVNVAISHYDIRDIYLVLWDRVSEQDD